MYNSKCIFKLCKNISKVYNNNNAIYNLISQYNSNDWEKYIFNYTNIKNCLYKDNLINVSLIKWPTHYVINSFNNTDANTDSNIFIKILKGSLLKTEYRTDVTGNDITGNYSTENDVTGTDVVSSAGDPIYRLPYNVDTLNYKNKNLLFIKSNTIYSINNNIIVNNNYPVSLHVNVTSC